MDSKKLIEKPRQRHNLKPQPAAFTKKKRKMTKPTRTKQTNTREARRPAPHLPKQSQHAKTNEETRGQRAREDTKTRSAP